MYRNSLKAILTALLLSVAANVPVMAQDSSAGVWISSSELASIEMEGSTWDQLKATAQNPAGMPDLRDKNHKE